MQHEVRVGDVLDVLPTLEAESFDACLCDPPYGLGFMGKAWDHGVPGPEVWTLVARALKPGAHVLAFGGTRTFHRLTCAIEDSGFEIRDCLMWIHAQGFPKSHNLSGAFQGYGTALKPAFEPVILAMKPTRGTFAENALREGVAGLNVDGGRIEATGRPHIESKNEPSVSTFGNGLNGSRAVGVTDLGRWPSNVLLDEEAAAALDEQSEDRGMHGAGSAQPAQDKWARPERDYLYGKFGTGPCGARISDSGGASRFFYVAKASREEREAGLQEAGLREAGPSSVWGGAEDDLTPGKSRVIPARNHHPTVKPIALCEYLAKLLLPPKRDTPRRILVPFAGSGSEMIGCLAAGWDEVVGIETESEYVEIAKARLAFHERELVGSLFMEGR